MAPDQGAVQPPFISPFIEGFSGKVGNLYSIKWLFPYHTKYMRVRTAFQGIKSRVEPWFSGFWSSFCRCGIAGWCMEVMFTSVDSIMAGDWRLMGRTSLLMFPIYGMGALLLPINCLIDQWIAGIPGQERGRKSPIRKGPIREGLRSQAAILVRHGLIDMVLIFTAEYISGLWLTGLGICPWDYSMCPDHVRGVIRLRFAPLWFGAGLLLEWLTEQKLCSRMQKSKTEIREASAS